jgi:hypothetical protein
MLHRVAVTLATLAAASAVVILAVFAAGYAFYAAIEPIIGAPGAAALVASISACGLLAAHLIWNARERRRRLERLRALATSRQRPLIGFLGAAASRLLARR